METKEIPTSNMGTRNKRKHNDEHNEEIKIETVLANEDGPTASKRQPNTQEMLENTCVTQYAHMTRTVLSDIYDRVKTRIKCLLKELQYIVITTDLWSGPMESDESRTNDFISITAHGLTPSFVLKSPVLEVLPFDGDNNPSENMTRNIKETLIKWEITDRVIAVATNNAYIVRVVNEFSEAGYNYQHIACDAHKLQIALRQGLFDKNHIKEIIDTARTISKYFNQSEEIDDDNDFNELTTSSKLFKETQRTLNLPANVLIQDVTTRWDSTFEMLKRLDEQRIAIETVIPKTFCPSSLSKQQWVLISKIVEILQIFRETTEALSKKGVTLSDIIPLINSVLNVLENMPNNDEAMLKVMATELTNAISSKFHYLEEEKFYILSTVLNPKYKTRVFRTSAAIAKAKKLLNLEIGLTAPVNPRVESQDTPSKSQTSTIWNVCKELINEKGGYKPLLANSNTLTVKEEVELYLKSPNIDINDDPYKYWEQNQFFPNIKKLALKYLTFTPAILPLERLFSTNVLQHTGLRKSLKPEKIEQKLKIICFLNKNLPQFNIHY